MMVETILESSQDFGMSNGALPQWKRELLQRRAARSRPPAPPPHAPPPPPPPPPPADDDEELRYGPGIVKRLKSRYLSLALRDAPRRRPSALRRAASLEHLLDERPPPEPAPRLAADARPPRPVSALAPPAAPAARRDSVKRARSVDALSRLDSRDESLAPPASPPPIAPRPPPQPRGSRPPRRPTPLLRDAERPPPDVVRSTLRKFEAAPARRAAPSARVCAALRDLGTPPRAAAPEPRPRDSAEPPPRPSPLSPVEAPAEPEAPAPRPVSRAALDGIARAGSTVRYAFEAPRAGSHLPPPAGRARRIGVIRPMPARGADDELASAIDDGDRKSPGGGGALASPSPPPTEPEPAARIERRDAPPAALVEPVPRAPPEPTSSPPPRAASPDSEPEAETKTDAIDAPLANGRPVSEAKNATVISRIGAAGVERAWSGSERKAGAAGEAPWTQGLCRRGRAPAPASTSVVFNFSDRKEVPDYIENDGIVLRAARRNRIKAGEPGVVVLRAEALARCDSDSESESELDCGPPSPLSVRFVNDNVLINGRSSMPHKPDRDRQAKLKLQFDDSLTQTFEYPSETSLCEEGVASGELTQPTQTSQAAQTPQDPQAAQTPQDPQAAQTPQDPQAAQTAQLAESPLHAPLAANTHIASAALSSYTPHKTASGSFQLGVTRHDPPALEAEKPAEDELDGEQPALACAALLPRSWSEARTHATDLLF